MSSSMLVHDTRLAGTAPGIATNTYKVNGGVQLKHALTWIAYYARTHGGLSDLFVMCHGIMSGVYDSYSSECTSDVGFGLQLCSENLTFANVQLASVLDGLVQVITLYACGPANTRRGLQNSSGDGFRFCSELSAITGAEVIASAHIQYYHQRPSANFFRRVFRIGPQDHIDFGVWEGSVYRFYPDGTASRIG